MKGLIGLLAVALAGGAIYWMALTKTTGTSASGTPAQVISTVGVENDLLAIAQAERAYQAEHGSYASMDELKSSGALTMQRIGRDGYTYSIDTTPGGFRATAKCDSSATGSCTNIAVDQMMQVHAAQ